MKKYLAILALALSTSAHAQDIPEGYYRALYFEQVDKHGDEPMKIYKGNLRNADFIRTDKAMTLTIESHPVLSLFGLKLLTSAKVPTGETAYVYQAKDQDTDLDVKITVQQFSPTTYLLVYNKSQNVTYNYLVGTDE